METQHQVKTGDFEGPLHLLLELVEKRKLFINELSLAEVADDYLEKIKEYENLPIEDVTGFLVISSTLVMIKSRSLLPQLEKDKEEEEEIEGLEKRLKLYQKIREQTPILNKNIGKNVLSFGANRKKMDGFVFAPDKSINKDILREILEELIRSTPKKKEKLASTSVTKTITLQEAFNNLETRINKGVCSFNSACGNKIGTSKEEKVHIVVNFLALLEMLKKGIIDATQDRHFEDIVISKKDYDHRS